ncbi:syndecan-2 [Xiphophorus hellerii]|uniref:syndecan-2 n=1 Tax=Xiphophorus hellerii TaxID=8084 RepID=UPI0013B4027E|nr:syndecan-2-like [Xiphophorus hellerii]XP_032435861.1 syndecan-2-like [Xiphophorus hellerii]XP_032435862.1 syndecan-2-like [Xiphophorus hellerii]
MTTADHQLLESSLSSRAGLSESRGDSLSEVRTRSAPCSSQPARAPAERSDRRVSDRVGLRSHALLHFEFGPISGAEEEEEREEEEGPGRIPVRRTGRTGSSWITTGAGRMRSGWILLSLALSCLCGAAAAARSSSPTDDLYLDDPGSGRYYPEDDDDFNSGSGSGGDEAILEETVTVSRIYMEPKAAEPTKDSSKFFSPRMEPGPEGGAGDGTARKPVRTELPVPVTEDQQRNQLTSTTEPPGSALEPVEVRTENLFQRTEVLAAVIAGGVIGFLFAIFLILLLVYRMRKKDEGSYDLGERKPSGAAYQKAPTKEFYA